MIADPDGARVPARERIDKANRFLNHEIPTSELYEWMARHTRWVMSGAHGDVAELAGAIELTFAELSVGHATKENLRDDIRRFVD